MPNFLDFIELNDLAETPIGRSVMRLGELYQVRRILMALGTAKFGPITPEDQARIEAIDDIPRLDAMCIRLLEVSSWEELLAENPAS